FVKIFERLDVGFAGYFMQNVLRHVFSLLLRDGSNTWQTSWMLLGNHGRNVADGVNIFHARHLTIYVGTDTVTTFDKFHVNTCWELTFYAGTPDNCLRRYTVTIIEGDGIAIISGDLCVE